MEVILNVFRVEPNSGMKNPPFKSQCIQLYNITSSCPCIARGVNLPSPFKNLMDHLSRKEVKNLTIYGLRTWRNNTSWIYQEINLGGPNGLWYMWTYRIHGNLASENNLFWHPVVISYPRATTMVYISVGLGLAHWNNYKPGLDS